MLRVATTRPSGAMAPSPSAERDSGPYLLVVCSSGGHLAQLVALRPYLASHRTRWVTFPTADALDLLAGQDVVSAHYPTTRNLPNLFRNTLLALRMLMRERPDAIVSTGAGVAVPFFVFGKLLGVPTVYLEVFDRLDTPTLTGRMCRPFADRMLVQWDEQQELYRGATVVGPVL
ncbi:MAG TPA: PssD/Cps14F family polysaccharide biosynthesis glycosyltransferase [Mycobacteriales bacterium]|jgi:UDP-N-acetylglucosamine:LPS N-acetylglucosamine transferase|nr:PssD/Cps14F family polysaccharide biosynthesis glycosyltransferase [Mycobacteriales bacterium]